ncbi:hypothetical protein AEYBE204_13095 [Asticcacaulis sp. YBE204]|nr:hypothetical protein AEYBE204_13095 [Asticcacaulis sp. YBE204]
MVQPGKELAHHLLLRTMSLHAALPYVLTTAQFQALFWLSEAVNEEQTANLGATHWANVSDCHRLLEKEWKRRQQSFIDLLRGSGFAVSDTPVEGEIMSRNLRAELASTPLAVRT